MRLTRYFFSNEVKTAMKTLEASVLADGLTFGEGPRWHENKLWISDMHANRILTCDLSGNLEEITQVPGRPSGLGWWWMFQLLAQRTFAKITLLTLAPSGRGKL